MIDWERHLGAHSFSLTVQGILSQAEEMMREDPSLIFTKQFENAANPWVHRLTTGPEIWQQTGGRVDVFISGVGTGGTVTGRLTLFRHHCHLQEFVTGALVHSS